MVRICMVGTGRMAVSHSQALGEMDDVALHTAINRRRDYAEAFCEEYGYQRAATSLEEALAQGGFDAVVICTPNQLHVPQSAAALTAGKHVLCEIPSALSLSDAEMLGGMAQERGLHMMSCHTERYEAGRLALRERIEKGELHPLHVIGRYYMLRRGELKTEQAHHGWIDNVLWHHGCHVIDAMMHIIGAHEPLDLAVQCGPNWPQTNAPLDWSLQWRAESPLTGDEVLVSVTLSHNAPWGGHDYRVIAREDDLLSDTGALSNREGLLVPSEGGRRVARQDAEFIAAIQENRPADLDMPAVLPSMRILQAAWDHFLARQR